MKTYRHEFTVNAPLAAVADFHHDTRALRLLTPPPIWVQFHDVQPLAENSLADFTLWMGPLPIRWVARHTEVARERGFTDTQVRGPFREWIHTHSFHPQPDGTTLVRDEIRAEPGGLISWGMWLTLPLLFAYRAFQTRRAVRAAQAAAA
ncbi:MAG: SRPBCC family protein [Anaerolineales bacterium]